MAQSLADRIQKAIDEQQSEVNRLQQIADVDLVNAKAALAKLVATKGKVNPATESLFSTLVTSKIVS